jgi:Xaa-Pro aminopeptidase
MGVEIHEPPFLVPRTEAPLEPGTVLTVEPGLYLSGVGGIRLEDDVVVTDGEPEFLSSQPLELRSVPA